MSHCSVIWLGYYIVKCQSVSEHCFSQDWMLQSQKEKYGITVFNSVNKVQ